MQQHNYYNEEDPPGDDDYTRQVARTVPGAHAGQCEPAEAAPTGIQFSSSVHVDSGTLSAARGAAQGEAAAILAQGS